MDSAIGQNFNLSNCLIIIFFSGTPRDRRGRRVATAAAPAAVAADPSRAAAAMRTPATAEVWLTFCRAGVRFLRACNARQQMIIGPSCESSQGSLYRPEKHGHFG